MYRCFRNSLLQAYFMLSCQHGACSMQHIPCLGQEAVLCGLINLTGVNIVEYSSIEFCLGLFTLGPTQVLFEINYNSKLIFPIKYTILTLSSISSSNYLIFLSNISIGISILSIYLYLSIYLIIYPISIIYLNPITARH